ncbi:MAG: glycosyltransferase family 39 protein [Desulfatitalea sp.]|nr:glycosyltransferase family 39 protein [Desulfatitalea sp.]
MMMLILSLMLPVLAAFLIFQCVWQDRRGLISLFSFRVNFAVGLGLGIASCTYFLSLLIFNRFSKVTETIFFISITLICIYVYFKQPPINCSEASNGCFAGHRRFTAIHALYWLLFIASVIYFIMISIGHIHGDWDAWAIWNMRARFLFRGGDQWSAAFSNIYEWSHPDYPLLLSGNVARSWSFIGNDHQLVPITTAFLFTFATIGLMVSSISHIKSKIHGLLAGMVLMGFVRFVENGATQQADIPFGFYLLAVIVCFYFSEKETEWRKRFLFLAGLMSGFAVWTKNEGFLLVCSVMAAHIVATVPIKGWKIYFAELASYLSGIFPILLIIAYFKMQLVPPNDIVAGQGLDATIGRLRDLSRYVSVSQAFIHTLNQVTKIRILIIPVSIVCLGLSWSKQYKRSIRFSAIMLTLMLSGYFGVYIISPHDLRWHLDTSLHRLYMQLLPSAIFAFFMLLKTPEEVVLRLEKA